jgi:carboxypeptidase Q
MRRWVTTLVFSGLAGFALAEDVPPAIRGTAERLRDAAWASKGSAEIVRSLTDHVGPRLSGSPGERAAEAWALATLKELGFEEVRAEPVTVPHWERGIETGEVTSPYHQKLVLTALGGSASTPDSGLERRIVPTENVETLLELLKHDPQTVKDRIVFFNERMDRTHDGSGYGRAVAIRWTGPLEAAKAGAVGVLIRTVGTSLDRLPHTGAMKPNETPIPAAALSAPDADLLERLSREGKPVIVRLTLTCRTHPDAAGANVIGEVKGSEIPEEIVLLGAHLDSWDLGTGALDDGAGVGIVLEAARTLSLLPRHPRRTVRVVLFANEENGGKGARAYAEKHRLELEKHVVALEMDLGTDRVLALSTLGGPEAEAPVAALLELLRPLGVTDRARDGEAGADVSRLREFGVPLFGLRQDAERYFDFHHSANDTFDKIDPANLAQATAATVIVAYVAAQMPGTFGRIPESKRKSPEW